MNTRTQKGQMASLFSVLDAHKTSRLGHSTQKTPGTEISEFHRTRDLSTLQGGASAGLTLDEARQLMVYPGKWERISLYVISVGWQWLSLIVPITDVERCRTWIEINE